MIATAWQVRPVLQPLRQQIGGTATLQHLQVQLGAFRRGYARLRPTPCARHRPRRGHDRFHVPHIPLLETRHRRAQEGLGAGHGGGQHRLERGGQQAEQVQALRAHRLQLRVGAVLLGDHPGLALVDVAVGLVGQRHHLAHGLAILVAGVAGGVAGERLVPGQRRHADRSAGGVVRVEPAGVSTAG